MLNIFKNLGGCLQTCNSPFCYAVTVTTIPAKLAPVIKELRRCKYPYQIIIRKVIITFGIIIIIIKEW